MNDWRGCEECDYPRFPALIAYAVSLIDKETCAEDETDALLVISALDNERKIYGFI